MNALTILNSFCDSEDFREYVRRPWVYHGFAYATNGHWMVRVPAAGLEGLTPYRKGVHPASAEQKFDEAPFAHLQPMARIDCAPCSSCNGRGLGVHENCPCCRGTGEFKHHGETYDCQLCDCTGKTLRAARDEEKPTAPCIFCGGTGYDFSGPIRRIEHRGYYFQPGYLAALSRLPGVQFGTHPDDGSGQLREAAFRFEGGEGLLMPCKPPTEGGAA